MSKHTPGPWGWDAGIVPPDGPERYADIYADDGDTIVANFNALIPEGEANARLIAAAPDLLARLKGVLPLIEWAESVVDPLFKPKVAATIESIRAALSKAESEPVK